MDKFLEILKQIKLVNNNFFTKKNKITISKKNNNIKFKILPRFIKSSNSKDNLELYKRIKNFLTVMNRDCKNFDPNIFIKNFKKTLFNIEGLSKEVDSGFDGKVKLSKINEFEIKNFNIINHEFLHLSSMENSIEDSLFVPYNEGYTQALAERYFNENKENSYNISVIIMKNIEAIIGRDYMEEKYFKGQLQITANKLLEYESKENLKILFKHMKISFDILNDVKDSKDKKIKFYSLQALINVIFSILTNCIKNRLEKCDNLIEKFKIFNSLNMVNAVEYYMDGETYRVNLFTKEQVKELKSCLYDNSILEIENLKK